MKYQIVVRPLAEQDLLEAQRWYDQKRPGLGSRFRNSVDEVLKLLADSPLISPAVYRGARRLSVKGFPYILYYVFRSDRVLILGCFHARRHPRIAFRRIERES